MLAIKAQGNDELVLVTGVTTAGRRSFKQRWNGEPPKVLNAINARFSNGDFWCMGDYSTEERAKEIICEIAELVRKNLESDKPKEFIYYEMPAW